MFDVKNRKKAMANKLYDLAFLKDYFDDDTKSILPVLEMYLEETPKEILKFEDSLKRNDTAAAKACAHKIKTNVAMLGIRDTSTFINDMHLLSPAGVITRENRQQFERFKADVTSGLDQIQKDFFRK